VDGAARGGKALEGFDARVVLVEGAQDALELPMAFLVRFTRSNFSREECDILLLYPRRVWYQESGLLTMA
jgi:hypothetical protein